MATTFLSIAALLLCYTPLILTHYDHDATCSQTKAPSAKPATQQAVAAPQGPVQYVYIPYVPGQAIPAPQVVSTPQGPVTYVYIPAVQGQTVPGQVAPQQQVQKPSDDGPDVAQVMTTFAGVLGGIVAMGMGAEYDNHEQEAQGLNMFIQNGAHLISLLTKQPCTEEQFARLYVRSALKLAQTRGITTTLA